METGHSWKISYTFVEFSIFSSPYILYKANLIHKCTQHINSSDLSPLPHFLYLVYLILFMANPKAKENLRRHHHTSSSSKDNSVWNWQKKEWVSERERLWSEVACFILKKGFLLLLLLYSETNPAAWML